MKWEWEKQADDEDGDGQEEQSGEEVLNRLLTACAPNAAALLALVEGHVEELSPVNAATLLNR